MQALDQMVGSSGMDMSSLAARFGLNPDQAQSALGSLMPAVLGGFQKKAEANDLDPATDAVSGTASDGGQPDTDAGNSILGHIFGGKDVSREVADHAAGQSGVSITVLKAMLPVVAAMVAKHLAGQGAGTDDAVTGGGGGLGGMLGSILGGGSSGGTAAGGLGGLGSLLGGGGNPLDQILARMR